MKAITGRQRPSGRALFVPLTVIVALSIRPGAVHAQQEFDRTRDRGPGIAVSQFGTYVDRGQFLFYPFLEYYYDNDAEYSPAELGYGADLDHRGKYRATEGLIFIAWGVSDRLAIEFEAAVISARQDKASDDTTAMPARVEESGLGDVEGQIRWRWQRETESRPAIFSYFETVFPIQKKKKLIGTQDWEFKLGAGLLRGFRWGTATLRLSIAYDEGEAGTGEYAVEYLKRISSLLKVYAGVEGTEDEVELITETQWSLASNVVLKLNNAFGLTAKASGWAPEVGLMFRFD